MTKLSPQLGTQIGALRVLPDAVLTDRVDDVVPGSTFVAVKGSSFDGHKLIDRAIQNGAVGLVVDQGAQLGDVAGVATVAVDNTRALLSQIAVAYYGYSGAELDIYGVTGTNGKTTTVQILGQLLASPDRQVRVVGTLSGALTTPSAPELHEIIDQLVRDAKQAGTRATLVMEVSSHALDQGRVGALKYQVAGFTNLSQDHLDYHGTMEQYFLAKAKLFVTSQSQRAVIFDDQSDWSRRMIEVSEIPTTTISLEQLDALEVGPTQSSFVWRGSKVTIPLGAAFNVANVVLAAEIAVAGGVAVDAVAQRLQSIQPVRGRLQRIAVGQSFDVIVDYAHTPAGLETVLSELRDSMDPRCRLITVFGCGGDRDATKRAPMGSTVAQYSDVAVVTSDNPRSEDPLLIIEAILEGISAESTTIEVIPDRRAAIEFALRIAEPRDVVVIAGKGHEQGQIINGQTFPFDDVAVATELLQAATGEATA